MSCSPCLRPYFLEKYFNFAFFFFLRKSQNEKKNISMLFIEHMYTIIIIIIKNVGLTTVVKEG